MVLKPYFLSFRSIWVHLQFSVRFVLLCLYFFVFFKSLFVFLSLFLSPIVLSVLRCPFGIFKLFFYSKVIKRKYPSNLLIMSVPDEDYSRDVSCALHLISTFLLHCIITGSIPLQMDYFSQKVYKWNIVECGVKNHQTKPNLNNVPKRWLLGGWYLSLAGVTTQ
jgi:hypothetical protein